MAAAAAVAAAAAAAAEVGAGGGGGQLGYIEGKAVAPGVTGAPYDSRAGGRPAFYSGSVEPAPPVCDSCHKPLHLFAQVHAPTEVDRSLLVFGCNTAACNAAEGASARHGTWVVLRTQAAPAPADAAVVAPAAAAAAAAAPVTTPTPAAAVAAPAPAPATIPAPAAAADDWGAGDAWGADERGDDSGAGGGWRTADDLTAEAAAVAAATAAAAAATAAATPGTTSATTSAPVRREVYTLSPAWDGTPYFAPRSVHVYDDEADEVASSSDSDDGSGAGRSAGGRAGGGGGGGGGSAADRHAASLLREYESWEASLKAAGTSSDAVVGGAAAGDDGGIDASGSDSGDDDGDDGGDDDKVHAKDAKRAAGRAGGDRRKGASRRRTKRGGDGSGSGKGGGGGGGGDDGYERVPPKFRYLLRFQRYLTASGGPVLRYAFDAAPIAPLSPTALRRLPVPPCPCGARRAFELQLFPPLLSALDVDTAAGAGGGVDFLTVLVYSCERSCDASSREVAVVIQPE